jgi:glycosyltransferase involved in cell wall biosynthesis
LICISDGVQSSLKRWLVHKFDNKIVVVNNGARLYNFKDRGNLSNQIRLVSIGSLSERKGFSNAIRAVSAVRDWVAKYTIVGEGPERAKLQKLIDDENLGDKVNLVGWSEQIETYLHEADIQLVPSLWEGFGLVAVEGMSTGLPVVASNVNGLNEILPENNPAVRLVTDFENPKAWVESINDIIKSMKTDRRRISRCAREQAQKYSLEVMVEKYKEVYTTL